MNNGDEIEQGKENIKKYFLVQVEQCNKKVARVEWREESLEMKLWYMENNEKRRIVFSIEEVEDSWQNITYPAKEKIRHALST
jgi:hypothetical protein